MGFNLTTLPDGVFDNLAALEWLWLRSNFNLTPCVFDLLVLVPGFNDFNSARGVFDDVLDTGLPDFDPSSLFGLLNYGDSSSETDIVAAFLVDDNTRSAHFVCSRTYAGTIVDATDGVDDCLRITAAQFNTAECRYHRKYCEPPLRWRLRFLRRSTRPACEAVPEAIWPG